MNVLPARKTLLNIEIDCVSQADLLRVFDRGCLVTPNVDHFMLLQDNADLLKAYQAAEYVVVDSQIVFWALRWLGQAVPEKISGSAFLPAYCEYHAKNSNKTLFILGGRPGVAARAMQNINDRVGKELVVGSHSPSMQFGNSEAENVSVIEMINQSKATTLIVGLGCPKQEIWINKNRHRLSYATSFLAVGAAIDFEAGSAKRAPEWVGRVGLEWAFRLVQEPARLWYRYLVRDPGFLWAVFKSRF